MTERVWGLSAAPLSAAAASALPQNLQSMGQANLLQATESMSGPLGAPPQAAWVGIGGGSEIAVGSKGNDGASLGLVGGTIVGGSSIGVAAKLAVDGASEPVASHGIDERSTCCTTTGGMGENRRGQRDRRGQ